MRGWQRRLRHARPRAGFEAQSAHFKHPRRIVLVD
jgi:hypothetical protein